MSERYRCSLDSRGREEPLVGTASQVRRWILVEQPGPWGADAISESRLPARIAAGLLSIAARSRARVLLIRRHGRYAPTSRSCFIAVNSPGEAWMEEHVFEDPEELLGLDWDRLPRQESLGGRNVTSSRYLVCTNGSHDPCCAEYGRPVAALLAATFPERVWEASHFGGDRFAANLLCLPYGDYFGRVDPGEAARLIEDYDDGQLTLTRWRGRSALPFPVQAAEYHLRVATGLVARDAVALDQWSSDGDLVTAEFSGPQAGRWSVQVRRDDSAPRTLTCHADRPLSAPRFALVRIGPLPG